MKYKLIVADFDDTILNSSMEYSDYFVQTVARYVAAGGHFHIATGRMPSAVIDEAKKIGLKGDLLTFQGAIVLDVESGEVVSRHGFEWETAYKIAKIIEDTGNYFHIYDGAAVINKEHNFFSKIYSKFSHCDSTELHYDISEFIKNNRFSPPKIMVMAEPDKVHDLLKFFAEKLVGLAEVNTSKQWMVEIVPIGMDKGVAVARLAAKLGIAQEDTLCIGDSLNDAPMLKWAGLGAIVANGSEEAKAYADVVIPSNDEEGVSYAIRKYGLEEDV